MTSDEAVNQIRHAEFLLRRALDKLRTVDESEVAGFGDVGPYVRECFSLQKRLEWMWRQRIEDQEQEHKGSGA